MNNSFISKLKSDLPAGLVVFLVALPLCLGISLASGAPLLSGVISGIIGGLVVGFLSGSHSSVSGPAAGLAAVVLTSIASLGNFEVFLLATLIAGGMQVVLGISKTGFIANYVPSNVIKGLLAAIGIILILKQIPHAAGYDADPEADFSFQQMDGENTITELLKMVNYFQPGAIVISLISLFILIFWDKTPLKKISFFPASLAVVALGILLNGIFHLYLPGLAIDATHLVNIPKPDSIASVLTFPDFSAINNYQVWIVALTIAIIASLETLLNLEAVENLDPHKRQASPNRELMAQGVGNIVAGLVGGIPVTSVIVRSSVNIQTGAESKMSTIFHGILLVLSLFLLSTLMNMIPLASLAAILIVTGYKLAKWPLFKEMYNRGLNQFIPFIATITAIIFTDLLIGILIGLAVSTFYLLKSNFKNPFTIEKEKANMGETIRIEFPNQVSFLNKASIKDTLWSLPNGSKVILDATYSDFIDSDVLEVIEDFRTTIAPEKQLQVNILGLRERYHLDDHIQFVNVLDKETQQKLKPAEILDILLQGNERFVKGKWTEKYLKQQVNATSFGQNPMAVVVTCIDSRTSPELIFDVGIGDVISIRIAGNIISKEILGSIELACQEIGTKLIVVLGHTSCGAIASAIHRVNNNHIADITNKIEKSIDLCKVDRSKITSDPEAFKKVISYNVQNSLDEIISQSTYLEQRISKGEISLVGGIYDLATGLVHIESTIPAEMAELS
jgi:MFS superfamily sulfate permease-like transporter